MQKLKMSGQRAAIIMACLLYNGPFTSVVQGQGFPNYNGYAPAIEAMRKWNAEGKHAQAAHAAQSALIWAKTDPERAEILLFLSKVTIEQKDDKADFLHVRRQGELEYAAKKYNEALQLPAASAQQKVQAQLGVANTQRLLASLLYKIEYFTAARDGYARLLEIPDLAPALRSEALLGRADNHLTLGSVLKPPRRDVIESALADYNQALAIEAASDEKKAQALLGMASAQVYLQQPEEVLKSLTRVVEMPGATIAQKTAALDTKARNLAGLNRRPEARTTLAQLIALEGVAPADKITAHRLLAIYSLQEKDLTEVSVQVAKISALLPALPADKQIETRNNNGFLLSKAALPALARAEYEAVTQLAGASDSQRSLALRQVGETYEQEKNYAKAREVWEEALVMKGVSSTLQTMLLEDIGKSYALQGLYPAARGAYQRWLALPGLKELAAKEISIGEAWLLIGDSYLAEKNYAEARAAYGKARQGGEVIQEEAQKKLQLLETLQKAG